MIKQISDHRSVRSYKPDPVSEEDMREILEAGARASNTGNMQIYSMIVTTDEELRRRLGPCHFNQPMVRQAPVHITFCVDIRRFSLWCEASGAEPGYDNFIWFVNGAVDAVLASQNVVLAAESKGLGVCYLGTATYNADQIIEVLDIPAGVIPVAAIVMGYPLDFPLLTDRLPLEGVVHYDSYKDYSPEELRAIWAGREASEETAELLRINALPNLATIFTRNRYKKEDNILFSRKYFETLKKQGFFNQ